MLKILQLLKTVYSRPAYVIWWALITLIMLSLTIILFNWNILRYVFSSNLFNWSQKFDFFISSFGSFYSGYSFSGQITLIFISILVGLNTSLLIFYLKQRIVLGKTAGLSFFGLIFSIIGVGCLSCGSIILTSLLGFSATVGIIGFLPFMGQEFSWLAIILLILSIYFLLNKMTKPINCKI